MSVPAEPFDYAFFRMALVAGVLIGVTCSSLGVYVVLRRMAFIGDALAHTVLPGLVVAYLNGWSLFGGAVAAGVLTALGIGWLARRAELREDTAIGIMFTGMFALGIALVSTTRSYRDLAHILFGNILAVTPADLGLILAVAALVLGTLVLFHKELELTSYDPSYAAVIGLGADRLRTALLILLAFAVVVGIQAVGVVLTSALLITPAAAASLLAASLPRMMALGAVVAAVSAILGLYGSFYLGIAAGPAIVLASSGCFGLAWLVRWLRLTRRLPS